MASPNRMSFRTPLPWTPVPSISARNISAPATSVSFREVILCVSKGSSRVRRAFGLILSSRFEHGTAGTGPSKSPIQEEAISRPKAQSYISSFMKSIGYQSRGIHSTSRGLETYQSSR